MKTIQWILLAVLIVSSGMVYAIHGDSCYKDCQCEKGEWCNNMGDFQWSGWGQCVRGDNPDNNSVKTAAPGSCKL